MLQEIATIPLAESSGYVAYEQQKKVNEMQARLDEEREAQAKREKQIAEFKMKVSDQEREWLDKEEALFKKRSEISEGRFDSTAKAAMLAMKLPLSETLMGSIDTAMKSVKEQLKKAEEEYIDTLQSGKSDEVRDKAQDHYHAIQARYDDLVKQQTIIQKILQAAMLQVVKNTDPNNQPQPVGGSV